MSEEEKQPIFTLNNYPKSYASTKLGDFRLKDFLDRDEVDLEKINDALFEFAIERGDSTEPLKDYQGLDFLDAGWEWSVFKKDEKTVIKVPAGIFPEVNDPKYLENTEETYQKIVDSYPAELVAKTTFRRDDDTNIMEQEFILGQTEFKVDLRSNDQDLLTNFKTFLLGTLKLVQDHQWLPDYWLTETEEGILVRNVVLESDTKLFKVIDFAQYLDPSRMYPQKAERVIKGQIEHLHKLINLIEVQLQQDL